MRSSITILVCLIVPSMCPAAEPPASAGPPVTITLQNRHGHVTPVRQGFTHTGGGNMDVAQPAPDTLVVTMTGVAVAGAHPCKDSVASFDFDLEQCLEIAIADPKVKKAKVSIEARVIGLLRSHKKGTAEQGAACATLGIGGASVVTLSVPPHSVAAGENQSINCHEGPIEVPVAPGQYTYHQRFSITASHPHCVLPCKAASAEFAPDPALDPLWISYWEPFHGAAKKDLGFQVILKAAPDDKKE
jgi:hypothetical protein